MKKALVGLAVVCAAVTVMAATYISIQGCYITGGTSNTVNLGGGTTNVGYLAAASTNNFNLSTVSQSQSNTNLWPAAPFNGNLGIPCRYLDVSITFTGVDANATNDYVWRLASSSTGSRWNSNAASISVKGQGTATVTTNATIDTGGIPFWAIQTEEAKTVSGCTAITNIYIEPVCKPGI